MRKNMGLLCGPVAAGVLAAGITVLPVFVPGYSAIRQTVSEVGEMGSPAQVPFSLLLFTVAALSALFALAVYRFSASRGRGVIGAILIAVLAVILVGLALCPFPHPLHNLFGTSELIVYQAPLAFALQWRKHPPAKKLVRFSWGCFAALWISLAANFVIFFRDSSVWQTIKPVYGLIQRSLFVGLCVWLAGTGLLLWTMDESTEGSRSETDRASFG